MMQQIRDGLKGPVIYGMLVLVVGVPFAFSGIEGYLQGNSDPVVAKVGDAKITQAQLRNAYDQRYRQLQQLYGENFRADLINPTLLREAVLKDMVQESLLRQHARSDGYRAADAALRDYLTKVPAFQENGQFSAKTYRELLARIGQTPERFEAQEREQLVIDQLREAVLGSSFVTPAESALATKLAQQKRDFAYLVFDPARYGAGITVSDADVAKRYEETKANYQAPERVKLAYVQLALDQLPKVEAPVADVLKTLYDSEKAARFSTPEVRDASHVLVNFGADKSAAKAKAEAILAELKGGADFATVAKAKSDDTGSKAKGGELGPIKRGDGVLPQKFEDALFAAAAAGELIGPVETEFGWHVIRLNDVKPARTQPFEDAEVQKTLVQLYQQTEAQKHFQELSSKLEELAFDNPNSLEPVAKALNLKIETTDWFTRAGGTGVLANAGVMAAAFSPEVLSSNENSKPITLDATHVLVLRKAEYEAPRQKTLAEVDAQIRESLRTEQAQAKAKAEADAALASLAKGETIDAVAKTASQPLMSPGASARDRADVPKPLLSAVFKLPRPAADKPSTGLAVLDKGEIAVIALKAVSDGEGAVGKEALSLRDARAGSEFAAYRAALEKQIKVDIKPAPAEEPAAP